MKVSVLGLGYVGLPVLMGLTKKTQHAVVGLDISETIIKKIQSGQCPVVDLETEKEFRKMHQKLNVDNNEQLIKHSDVFIICVPTPIDSSFNPNYAPLVSASTSVGKNLKKGSIVVVESTVNPGACEEVVVPVLEEFSNLKFKGDFQVVHSPERINPGDKKWNVYNLPRNIGGSSIEAAENIKNLYSEFIDANLNIVSTLKVAEASKIIENSFRDLNIAFVNELAKSFDLMGIDLHETINAAANKPLAFLAHYPGPGVGGHCIAVDPYYLIRRSDKAGFNLRMLKEAREINNSMPSYTITKMGDLLNRFERNFKNTKIGVLGVSYKGNVGDTRESPSIEVIKLLKEKGAKTIVFDPFVESHSDVKDLDELLENVNFLLILTDHGQFKSISIDSLKENDILGILDTKNIMDFTKIRSYGIEISGIGK